MAKDIVERTSVLMLPAWSALGGELSFGAGEAQITPGSAKEINVVDAQLRPDVRVGAVRGRCYLHALYVEIRVSHAVDHAKRKRVIDQGLSMVEIDLSGVSDEMVQDEAAFTDLVLRNSENRHWIHIGNAAFLAEQLATTIYQVTSTQVRDKHVPTKSGNSMIFQEQMMLRYKPGGDEPSAFLGELANIVRPDGQRIDSHGTPLPYAPGLYILGQPRICGPYDNSHYKTLLRPLVADFPWTKQGALI